MITASMSQWENRLVYERGIILKIKNPLKMPENGIFKGFR